MAEKLEAYRLLEDVRTNVDREAVRVRLIDALKHDFAPQPEDPHADRSDVRCWLLGALGRVPPGEVEIESMLLQHTARTYEQSAWARYWALEALVRRTS